MLLTKIIWRYLRARRDGVGSVMVWFSLIGIILGVATLIVVMSVMNGFRQDLVGRIIGLNGHVAIRATPHLILGQEPILSLPQGLGSSVLAVTPSFNGQAIVRNNQSGRYRGVLLTGLDRSGLEARHLLFNGLTRPDDKNPIESFANDEGVLIGDVLSRQMGLAVGDTISLVAPVFDQTAFGSFPRLLSLPVAGIFSVGMSEYDSGIVVVPLATMQSFFAAGQLVESYDIFLDNPDSARAISAQAHRWLRQRDPSGQYRLIPWQESNATLTAALVIERNVMFVILSLIIIVAAFNILTGQTMMVNSRLRSIAILRTIGLSVRQILWIFLCSGLAIGIVGTAIGTAIGVTLARNLERLRLFIQDVTGLTLFDANVYFLRALPSQVDWHSTMVVVITAIVLSLVFSVIPALKAARTDPATALRN